MRPHELKTLRKELKINLLELAANTGLPQNYLEQIEEGEVVPLGPDLWRIEKALHAMAKDPARGDEL